MCLVLLAVVGINQPLWPSEKKGIVPQVREETLQRMKMHEVRLRPHQLRLEKEIADLEATQEDPAQPAAHLERKIQRHTCTLLGLVVPVLLVLCRQHWQGATAQHTGQGHADPGLLAKACKGVAFLTKPFVLLRAISISMGRTLGDLWALASRLLRLPLKYLHSTTKVFVLCEGNSFLFVLIARNSLCIHLLIS